MSGSEEPVDSDSMPEGVDDVGEWDDGSQWELVSKGEGSIHSHEESQHLNRISLKDVVSNLEDDDRMYVWAVQVKVVEIQRENPSQAVMHLKINHPRCSRAHESCLAAFVLINGMEAFALFDSGSLVDTISPDFV